MADSSTSPGPGDTEEFLRLMGGGAGHGEAPASGGGPDDTMAFIAAQAGGGEAPASAPPAVPGGGQDRRQAPQGRRTPVVIKGGPRRVVRSDGRMPDSTPVEPHVPFSLSSGHALFAPRRRGSAARASLVALACLVAVAVVFAVSWNAAQARITQDARASMVGTSAYDGALSLTPSDDGGYYTAFFVTSTPTDEVQVGDLSAIVLYRYDKDVSSAMRVYVPANLYVAPRSSGAAASTVQGVLADQGVSRALQAVDAALGTRIHDVVVCQDDVFEELSEVLWGRAPASSLDPQSYFGAVRSSLTLEGIAEFCGRVGALDQSGIVEFTIPVTEIDVSGTVMAECTPDAYRYTLGVAESLQAEA